MRQYLRLLNECFAQGSAQKNRTGIDTCFIPGGMMTFDLQLGFPILTTKAMPFKTIAAELCGFIRGYTSAAQFRELGCQIWDANANENKAWLENPNRFVHGRDYLGRIYGAQWREWRYWNPSAGLGKLDQLKGLISTLRTDPTSRRMIVTAWRPDELDNMALPPCHLLFQLLVSQSKGTLNMCMYMRSCDMFLGVPFNITSYALLLSIIARATGYLPGTLTMFLADVHIYENHFDQVVLLLGRSPTALPTLSILKATPHPREVSLDETMTWIDTLDPGDFSLIDYYPQPAIRGDMAV